jgi:hypothetical protein
MRKKISGFYADSLEMLLDTMCNVLGGIIFITLTLAVLVRSSSRPEAYAQETAEMTNALSSISISNSMLDAEISRTMERLQNTRAVTHTNKIRLPQAGITTKEPWEIVLKHGQLYSLNAFSSDGSNRITRNRRSIDWRPIERGAESLNPKPGDGDEPETGLTNLVRAFQRTSRTHFYFAFQVYEDSFDTFARAEETVTQLGFQYGWEPLPKNTLLVYQQNGRSERVPPQN